MNTMTTGNKIVQTSFKIGAVLIVLTGILAVFSLLAGFSTMSPVLVFAFTVVLTGAAVLVGIGADMYEDWLDSRI